MNNAVPMTDDPTLPAPARLLNWYDTSARVLPWRMPPGSTESADPYRVWLSEVMLQQTTVATVVNYFQHFTGRWPTVEDLAAAPLDDVLHAWQGLGYYARARNLHACAKAVVTEHDGAFPGAEAQLLKLPGIGPYTAAAITAIAFNRAAVAVDGNIERVIARQFAIKTPLPGAKSEIKACATERLAQTERFGDYTQAMMDLGARICTPKTPDCGVCPIAGGCVGWESGVAADLPRKAPKAEKPSRHGIVFWIEDADGRVLVRKRPESGLLGGMDEIPSTTWGEAQALSDVLEQSPLAAAFRMTSARVKHTFTHFHLHLTVAIAKTKEPAPVGCRFIAIEGFKGLALPTVMKKVIDQRLQLLDL